MRYFCYGYSMYDPPCVSYVLTYLLIFFPSSFIALGYGFDVVPIVVLCVCVCVCVFLFLVFWPQTAIEPIALFHQSVCDYMASL